jgi:hypothetical protein
MADRFDLESQIMEFANMADDMDTLVTAILEGNLSTDDTVNALIGMAVMTRIRVDRTFDTFKAVFKLDEYKQPARSNWLPDSED